MIRFLIQLAIWARQRLILIEGDSKFNKEIWQRVKPSPLLKSRRLLRDWHVLTDWRTSKVSLEEAYGFDGPLLGNS